MGQLSDGSHGSRVTKDDPLPSLHWVPVCRLVGLINKVLNVEPTYSSLLRRVTNQPTQANSAWPSSVGRGRPSDTGNYCFGQRCTKKRIVLLL